MNRDNILSPSGGKWNHTVFIAGGGNGKGIIGNRIYIGELVWNRSRSVISPETETRCKQKGKPEDLLTVPVPHMRIIDQALWDRAQKVRVGRSRQGSAARVYKKSTVNHLLAGRLTCEVCGGPMQIVWSQVGKSSRVGCTNAQKKGVCANTKGYDLSEIEATVLDGIKCDLDVESLMAYTEGAHKEWAVRQRAAGGSLDRAERGLNQTVEKIARVVDAIAECDGPAMVKSLMVKFKALELEKGGWETKRDMAISDGGGFKVETLHPAVIQNFRKNLMTMHTALTNTKLSDAETAPFRVAFGNVFDRVVVHQTGKRQKVVVTPHVRIAAIMGGAYVPKARTAQEALNDQGLTNLALVTQETLEQLRW